MKKELRKKFITERNTLAESYRDSANKKIFETIEKHEVFLQAKIHKKEYLSIKKYLFLLASAQKFKQKFS